MRLILLLVIFSLSLHSIAQQPVPKQLAAKRTTASIKIDGIIDEPAWKEVQPATDFVEWRPTPGVVENATNKTVVYLIYDNTSVYIGGYCYEAIKRI